MILKFLIHFRGAFVLIECQLICYLNEPLVRFIKTKAINSKIKNISPMVQAVKRNFKLPAMKQAPMKKGKKGGNDKMSAEEERQFEADILRAIEMSKKEFFGNDASANNV